MTPPTPSRLNTLIAALESQRPLVAAHSRRVATLAVRLAAQFGVSSGMIEAIRIGALLHDIGKLAVRPRILDILHRAGRLTPREWRELKIHPQVGAELVNRAGVADDSCEIVLYHHERWDGSGYPDRLAGRNIEWVVRLVSVMDAFDALTSTREYRQTLSIEAAKNRIVQDAGKQFCPGVVSGLISLPASLLDSGSIERQAVCSPDGWAGPEAVSATRAWARQA